MSNIYATGFINTGKYRNRYKFKILRILDYLNGISFARQQINFLKPRFILNCEGDILEIGGFDSFYKKNYKKGSYLNYDIVKGPEIDIVGDAGNMVEISDEKFSAVICISVLEHTLNPEKMLKEIFRILKKNGRLYLSVPWIFEWHMEPKDYLRFSDSCMVDMFERTGFVVEFKSASNSIYGTIAHFLQKNIFMRYTFGLFFAFLEQFFSPSFKYSTQLNYFLLK
jgi:SAM-dependent methyltransferase